MRILRGGGETPPIPDRAPGLECSRCEWRRLSPRECDSLPGQQVWTGTLPGTGQRAGIDDIQRPYVSHVVAEICDVTYDADRADQPLRREAHRGAGNRAGTGHLPAPPDAGGIVGPQK